jgi:molybdopterin-binding aldehyde dehydrogenase-like protein
VRGAIVQGIGSVLYEECIYDKHGSLVNGTLADYLVPMAHEMPEWSKLRRRNARLNSARRALASLASPALWQPFGLPPMTLREAWARQSQINLSPLSAFWTPLNQGDPGWPDPGGSTEQHNQTRGKPRAGKLDVRAPRSLRRALRRSSFCLRAATGVCRNFPFRRRSCRRRAAFVISKH